MDIKKRYNREEKKSGYKEKIKREEKRVGIKRRYKSKYKIDKNRCKNRYRKQHIIMLNAANYYGTIFTMKISR